MMPPWARLLITTLLILLPRLATAGVVESVALPGFGGEMTELRPGMKTGEAVAVGADGTIRELGPGVDVGAGDTIVTQRARVVVDLGDDERVHIAEASRLELTAGRTVLQHVGEVCYRVREAFTVQYGSVETAVEGTRFLVVGTEVDGGPVRVSVDEGVVRVTTPEGVQRVSQGQSLGTTPGAPPVVAEPWAALDKGQSLGKTLSAGPPRVMLGGVVAGAFTGAVGEEALRLAPVGTVQGRLLTSVRVFGPLRATAQLGLGGGARSIQVPGDVGMELMMGHFAFGASAAVVHEQRDKGCGEAQTWLHIGGLASGRAELPLGRHLRVLGTLRVGAVGTLMVDAGAGLGVVL